MLRSLARMNLVSTQHALLPCLAPDHSGLEANVLRFDDPFKPRDVAAHSPPTSDEPFDRDDHGLSGAGLKFGAW